MRRFCRVVKDGGFYAAGIGATAPDGCIVLRPLHADGTVGKPVRHRVGNGIRHDGMVWISQDLQLWRPGNLTLLEATDLCALWGPAHLHINKHPSPAPLPQSTEKVQTCQYKLYQCVTTEISLAREEDRVPRLEPETESN